MTTLARLHDTSATRVAQPSTLRLPAASSGGRGYLLLRFASASAHSAAPTAPLRSQNPDQLDDEARRFIADLRELGGMTVIA